MPLTIAQVRRRACHRCGQRPGYAIWSICADGNRPRVLCWPCDVELNTLVLQWARDPKAGEKMRRYEKRRPTENEE